MASDFKYKLDIFRYASKHGLFFRDAFSGMFKLAKKAVIKKGEEVKFPINNEPHLVFLHEGAVLGTLTFDDGASFRSFKVPQSIFLTGPENFLDPNISNQKWEAANRSEFTAIPINILMDSLSTVEKAPEKLTDHIRSVMDFDARLYGELLGIHALYDKVDYLVYNHPKWFSKTPIYLASYLNISQDDLSDAIHNWDQLNFGS
ncbi:hypothetical protein [Arthrospiribacter ruber]|uniref:Uncharacterized protein n=1 Tax=Arthrospiribacter ruber TaxID=2487934 RepID=A0A951ISC9_9BACT|nr:hypothetical protein [Arthrospiribacter ruber]MBW3466603.1 hypothetical protein [Arthrospiribacter ruber]